MPADETKEDSIHETASNVQENERAPVPVIVAKVEKVTYPCRVGKCKFAPLHPDLLAEHVALKHKTKQRKTVQKTVQRNVINAPISSINNQTIKCPECVEIFASVAEMSLHYAANHKKYPCTECKFNGKSKVELRGHIQMNHNFF